MTIEEMLERKRALGYTNEIIAERSGVPLSTVQKIFSCETKSPRYATLQKLEKALFYGDDAYYYYKNKEKKTVHNADYSGVPVSRRLGVAKGKFPVPDDIDFCNDEILELFEV